ncbi:unnamed protein product [Effrenium voratum]|nr:unnamed protein product [Effrenium voratum]
MGRCARLAGLCVQNASAECHYFQQCHAHCFAVALGSSAPGRCGPGAAPAQPLQLERRAARTFCRAELWGSRAAALGAAARWRRKLRLLARMGQEAAAPSVMSLTEVSRWHWALRLLNGMLRRRVRLDGQALAAGAAACEKAGAWRPALHLAQSCAALGGATSCALGAACAASGRWGYWRLALQLLFFYEPDMISFCDAKKSLARGVSQVLAEPMAWNQAPVIVTTLPNGVKVGPGNAEVATKETFAEAFGLASSMVGFVGFMARALVLPVSPRPGAGSSLSKAWQQLQACEQGALPPAIFLVVLGASQEAPHDFDQDQAEEVCSILQKIRRPLIGVATGFLGKAAVALLRGCDRVLAGEEARFREGEQLVTAEALQLGLLQVVPAANLGCEIAALAKQLEMKSSDEALASMKVNFLCAKVLRLMQPQVQAGHFARTFEL